MCAPWTTGEKKTPNSRSMCLMDEQTNVQYGLLVGFKLLSVIPGQAEKLTKVFI